MGTRHLVCVVLDGAFRVANYGQWDGYPTGQGETIKEFFSQPDLDLGRLRDNVAASSFLTSEDAAEIDPLFSEQMTALEAIRTAAYASKEAGAYEKAREAERLIRLDPDSLTYLSRDTGAQILDVIYAHPRKLKNEIEFAGDGLFCEWAYVVDLDAMTLEIYQGFNKDGPVPDENRFAFLNRYETWHQKQNPSVPKEYWPPKLFKTIDLSDLPTTDMEKVEQEAYPDNEEGCPGHEASDDDPKVCRHCGTNVAEYA